MKAIIIDDERHCIEALQALITRYCDDIEVVDTCQDGLCGLDSIKKHHPDLIFLDIAMPRMNGFDMLNQLSEINFEIIFTTAHDNYAIKAFKVCAIDYLLKPIDRKELVHALDLAKEKLFLKTQASFGSNNKEQLNILLENLLAKNQVYPNIAIPTMEGLEILKTDQILYVIGEGNYSQIHIKDRQPILISKIIKFVEERVDNHRFIRIHNSCLINVNEVSKYIKGAGGQVEMSDGKVLNVARTKKDELLKVLRK